MTEQIDGYGAAQKYISATPKFTKKNSMDNTEKFLAHLGYPAQNCKILHVAGTNGKGSVCAYLSTVLRKAGISCGMFVSPHLVTMRERFVIDGEMVTEEAFLESFHIVKSHLDDMPKELQAISYHPTFFEFLFFMAMVLFEKRNVEYVVLETGLGGRLDATNVVTNKKLCILTSIGYDHMEYLGETLTRIAGEKAGILRPGVPVVYPVKQPEVARVIEETASRIGSETFPVERAAIKEIKILDKTIDFSLHLNYYDYIGFTVSTSALYQIENVSLAATAFGLLADTRITAKTLQDGIRETFWEGRMEEIFPGVYLDGAHNIDGIEAFLETVRAHPVTGRRKLLFSMVRDKQYRKAAQALAGSGLFDEIGLAALSEERALPLQTLEDSFGQYTGICVRAYDTLEAAFTKLLSQREDKDRVYIVGSLYLAGEIKALIRRSVHDQF